MAEALTASGRWQRFNGGREGSIWYYTELSKVFQRVCPGILSAELRDTVAAFTRYDHTSERAPRADLARGEG